MLSTWHKLSNIRDEIRQLVSRYGTKLSSFVAICSAGRSRHISGDNCALISSAESGSSCSLGLFQQLLHVLLSKLNPFILTDGRSVDFLCYLFPTLQISVPCYPIIYSLVLFRLNNTVTFEHLQLHSWMCAFNVLYQIYAGGKKISCELEIDDLSFYLSRIICAW